MMDGRLLDTRKDKRRGRVHSRQWMSAPQILFYPPSLPADDSATKNDVADGSILDAFVAHSESCNDGLSLSLFSVEDIRRRVLVR